MQHSKACCCCLHVLIDETIKKGRGQEGWGMHYLNNHTPCPGLRHMGRPNLFNGQYHSGENMRVETGRNWHCLSIFKFTRNLVTFNLPVPTVGMVSRNVLKNVQLSMTDNW